MIDSKVVNLISRNENCDRFWSWLWSCSTLHFPISPSIWLHSSYPCYWLRSAGNLDGKCRSEPELPTRILVSYLLQRFTEIHPETLIAHNLPYPFIWKSFDLPIVKTSKTDQLYVRCNNIKQCSSVWRNDSYWRTETLKNPVVNSLKEPGHPHSVCRHSLTSDQIRSQICKISELLR